jgi:tRNA threonylcarbamoyladenosine biosynthesis protein TsaB
LPPNVTKRPSIVLAFDTSAAHCAAAVLFGPDNTTENGPPHIRDVDACTVQTACELMSKGQAERLLPMSQELLRDHGVAWSDVTLLAVGVGPGNFTGIRIAISLVRGLALGLNVPAIGINGFDATARVGARAGPFWTVINAPRDQIYAKHFPDGDPQLMAADAASNFTDPVLRCGDLDPCALVTAIGKLALVSPIKGAPRPSPLYLRPADAAPPSDPPPRILP